MNSFDCVVIGGGLVGSALAYGLCKKSLKTAMLDEGDVAYRASRGNFGLVWVQGKGRNLPAYARWSKRSSANWAEFGRELQDVTEIDVAYSRDGGVIMALTEQELDDTVTSLNTIRQQVGADYQFEVLDNQQLADLLPGVGPTVAGGTFCPDDGHANSLRLFHALHEGFNQQGGVYFGNNSVTAINALAGGGFSITTAQQQITAEKVVIAAGLGSRELATAVGLNMPVTPLQGQILVTERVQPLLKHPTNIVRQTDDGTFLLGYSQADVEFDTRTESSTLRDIAWRCQQAFPYLGQLRTVRAWSALRVMTPDGLPIYDQSVSHPGAFAVACHSGVTLAANHAQEVAGWIADGVIPTEFNEFSANRWEQA